jgi:hypothetical protein
VLQEAAQEEVAAPILVLERLERRELAGVLTQLPGQDGVGLRDTEFDEGS